MSTGNKAESFKHVLSGISQLRSKRTVVLVGIQIHFVLTLQFKLVLRLL